MLLRSGRVIGETIELGYNHQVSVAGLDSFNFQTCEAVLESGCEVSNVFVADSESDFETIFGNLFEVKPEQKMATLKELAAPDLNVQPLAITYTELEKPLKLNSGFINLLPKFHGLPGEDPFRNISEFLITCGAMVPEGVAQDQIRLRAFPFSLRDKAKYWLYYMPAGSFTTWNALHKAFLEKYFPASRIGSIRKDICGVKQMIGLLPTDRNNVDAASGGALVNKTPTQARELFNLIAQNTQQFGTRETLVKKDNELESKSIEQKLSELTFMMSKLVSGGGNVRGIHCGVCCLEGHATDACPTLQNPEVNAVFYNNQQRKYDPYSNSYNEGWKDHPNLRYGPPQNNTQNFNQANRGNLNLNHQPSQDRSAQMLEQILKKMDDKFSSFDSTLKQVQEKQTATDVIISNLQAQMNQRIPSQPFPNPKENISAVVLRNKKQLPEPKGRDKFESEKEVPKVVNLELDEATVPNCSSHGAETVGETPGNDTPVQGERVEDMVRPKAPFPTLCTLHVVKEWKSYWRNN
ncbi:unnamed protein product [Cuscuta campestris]|uniref:Retrotransposon gag domain-containing protein n=1 Tax=Cuscuta campestris TaxID=132261 RepID=A0A484LAA4_9ASTE|nr:unnamed protein product [Cuscuta campestris]